MDANILYPILLFVLFVYINQHFILPDGINRGVYICLAIYYCTISPIYGLLIAILLIFFDRIQQRKYMEGFTEHTTDSIPHVIYQTWQSKELPPKMADCMKRLKEANPNFEHQLYDDATCRTFIETTYDADVLDAYDTLLPGAFKADLWRYCILYDKGGVYLDIKFQCEPGFSFEDIVSNGNAFYVREYNHNGTGLYPHIIYTGCIASPPKNPVFLKCIRQIVENCKNRYYGPEHTSPTGPYLFASMMEPEEIETAEYAYYEENGVGYIRHIDKKTVILSHYPEYRAEQKTDSTAPYWKDAWINREIYRT